MPINHLIDQKGPDLPESGGARKPSLFIWERRKSRRNLTSKTSKSAIKSVRLGRSGREGSQWQTDDLVNNLADAFKWFTRCFGCRDEWLCAFAITSLTLGRGERVWRRKAARCRKKEWRKVANWKKVESWGGSVCGWGRLLKKWVKELQNRNKSSRNSGVSLRYLASSQEDRLHNSHTHFNLQLIPKLIHARNQPTQTHSKPK